MTLPKTTRISGLAHDYNDGDDDKKFDYDDDYDNDDDLIRYKPLCR